MWFADITIHDNVNNKKLKFKYKFTISNYQILLKDLNNIYPYHEDSEISFNLIYLQKNYIIDDLSKYILNRDTIIVYINNPEIETSYILTDISGSEIYESDNINNVYKYYTKVKYQCLLYEKIDDTHKLIDVLNTDENEYNACMNRLIHRYNY